LVALVLSAFTFLIRNETAVGIISVVRDFIFAPAAYCLYRSARSLAPMNRLQAIDPETIPSANAMKT
jgi:hypothetical protein